jgi:hypothetical protein
MFSVFWVFWIEEGGGSIELRGRGGGRGRAKAESEATVKGRAT